MLRSALALSCVAAAAATATAAAAPPPPPPATAADAAPAAAAAAEQEEYVVHALSAAHRRPAAWRRTLCGSVRDPRNMTDIVTAFGAGVTPANAWPEYPRPQLTRDEATTFASLNGLWEFELAGALDAPPFGRKLAQTILVPFPLESCLSGAYRWPAFSLWTVYRLLFDAPFSTTTTDRTLLHFGASDWNTTVFLNGALVTTHLGGYDAFSADVTDLLAPASNELIVQIFDPNGAGSAPAGKQRYTCNSEPASIWYGTNSGIWQTVWLERVPSVHVAKLRVRGDLASIYVTALAEGGGGAAGSTVEVAVSFGGQPVASGGGAAGAEIAIAVPSPRLWSPAEPNLYDLVVTLTDTASGTKDVVGSYVGMRTIALGTFAGKTRPALNGKPVFFSGTLDQSWWREQTPAGSHRIALATRPPLLTHSCSPLATFPQPMASMRRRVTRASRTTLRSALPLASTPFARIRSTAASGGSTTPTGSA